MDISRRAVVVLFVTAFTAMAGTYASAALAGDCSNDSGHCNPLLGTWKYDQFVITKGSLGAKQRKEVSRFWKRLASESFAKHATHIHFNNGHTSTLNIVGYKVNRQTGKVRFTIKVGPHQAGKVAYVTDNGQKMYFPLRTKQITAKAVFKRVQ